MQVDSPTGLSAALACAIVPATSVLTGILLLATHLMEKMSMTGAPPGPLIWGPDAIMGALFGAGTFVYAGYIMPWLAHCLKRPFKVGVCAACIGQMCKMGLELTPRRLLTVHAYLFLVMMQMLSQLGHHSSCCCCCLHSHHALLLLVMKPLMLSCDAEPCHLVMCYTVQGCGFAPRT